MTDQLPEDRIMFGPWLLPDGTLMVASIQVVASLEFWRSDDEGETWTRHSSPVVSDD